MFKFYLHIGNSYFTINSANQVTTTNVATPIQTPDGWQNIELTWGRNVEYWGVFRSVSTPLQFVEDGARILRHIYYGGGYNTDFGVEAKCTLTIFKQNPDNGVWDFYYSGDIDFSQFKDEAFKVTVNVIESGLNAYLNAYADTNFAIPINIDDSVRLLLDGIWLESGVEFVPIRGKIEGRSQTNGYIQLSKAFAMIAEEGAYKAMYPRQTAMVAPFIEANPIKDIGQSINANSATLYYVEALTPLLIKTVKISENLHVQNGTAGSSPFQFRIRMLATNSQNTVVFSQILYVNPIIFGTGTYQNFSVDINTSVSCQLEEGGKVFIIYEFDTLQNNGTQPITLTRFDSEENPENSLKYITKFSSAFRLKETEVRGYRIPTVFDKLCRLMSNNTGAGTSPEISSPNYISYDSRPNNVLMTCGDALRNLTTPQLPAISTNFNEFFKSIGSLYSLGLGIEGNYYRLSPISYFLNKDIIISDLGDVSELEIAPAKEYIFNGFTIGYEDQEYDEVNGRDEYNTKHEYKLPITTLSNKKDMVSNYRADIYGIETYRANLSQKTTTDSASDNDTFIIQMEGVATDGVYRILRPSGTISGVLYPQTAYNIPLTPKRSLWRNAPLIASTSEGLINKVISYQLSKKNNNLQSNIGSGLIIEKADVNTNTLPEPLFLPVLFTFTCVPPDNIASLMATNPIGCFIFTYNGVQFKGFPMKVGTKPATWESYEMTLLATPDTDITQLIY